MPDIRVQIREDVRQLIATRGTAGLRAALPVVQQVHDELHPKSARRASLAVWLGVVADELAESVEPPTP